MLHAIWLGSIFGPFLAIHGLWMLLCRSALMKAEASLKSTPSAFHMVGVVQLIIGLAIINTCCTEVVQGLGLLLAIFGWLLILRAVLVFFLPKLIMKTLSNGKWNAFIGLLSLVWGLAICWLTFN